MYSIFILCVIGAASAALHYGYYQHGDFYDQGFQRPLGFGHPPPPPYPGIGEEVFDTRAFWLQIAAELKKIDETLKDFNQRFPSSVFDEGFERDQYKIVIPLMGFKREEITVNVTTGGLFILAQHQKRTYMDLRTLPECIDPPGTWSYDKDVLTIEFPAKKSGGTTETAVTHLPETQDPQTETPNTQEEMGHDDDNNILDVDIRYMDDIDQDQEVETRE